MILHFKIITLPSTLINLFATAMEDLTINLCWELVNKEEYIAIWQKPSNNSCYLSRDPNARPSLCDTDENPDEIWYFWHKFSLIMENNQMVLSWHLSRIEELRRFFFTFFLGTQM